MADPEIPRDVTPGATHGVPVEELGMSGGETPAEAGVTSTGVNQGNGSSVTEWHSASDTTETAEGERNKDDDDAERKHRRRHGN